MNNIILELSLAKEVSAGTNVVLIGLTEISGKPTLVGASASLESEYKNKFGVKLLDLAQDLGADTDPETVRILPTADHRAVVVGLGDADVTPETLRKSLGNAVRAINTIATKNPLNVAISLELSDPELIKAAGEGALLGGYEITKISAKPKENKLGKIEIISTETTTRSVEALIAAQIISTAVYTNRDWVNLPPNLLYPESFAAKAKEYAKNTPIDVEVLDEKALAKGGYGGVLAVGNGSSRKPRVVRFDYHPREAKFHLNLVGKGITFDSGGLNLKPGDSMNTMKCDMSGAAAVLTATKAIAELGLNIHVTTYAGMAENLPSATSYRTSDVLTMFDGQTVENVNTDAEGRLVLADLIARSSQDNPDLIIDVATLTGACMVALGIQTIGLMASDDATADQLLDAAESAGEAIWQLPIPDHIRKGLDSKIADMRSGADRYGGALSAAAFLQRFVKEEINWAHLDIAGAAFNENSPYGYIPTGGTGCSVRTLVALAINLANTK